MTDTTHDPDDNLLKSLRNSKGWPTLGNAAADRIEELEAKLAKAVEALVQIVGKKYYADDPWGIANAALATLKEQDDE
jgi:hypothetical protein